MPSMVEITLRSTVDLKVQKMQIASHMAPERPSMSVCTYVFRGLISKLTWKVSNYRGFIFNYKVHLLIQMLTL